MMSFEEFKQSPDQADGWRLDYVYYPTPGQYPENTALTDWSDAASLYYMGRTEVIEFTDEVEPDSTSIDHVWYNANTLRLTVRFHHSGTYSYDGVDDDLFSDFVHAPSLGQFFHNVFQPKGDEKWPGARHDERKIRFEMVEREVTEVEADLDALKPTAITGGKGTPFILHFTYSAKGQMTVRAEDLEEAVKVFQEYMGDHGFQAKVTAVTIDLTKDNHGKARY